MHGAIKAAIIDVLNQAALVNKNWVYTYEPTIPSGFPAISVTASDGDGKFADTQRNRRNYIFKIRCYQERQTVGTQGNLVPQAEAERILVELVDQLIAVFDNFQNYNLKSEVPNLIFVTPVPSKWGYATAPNPDVRIADIMLNAVVVQ